MAKLRHGNYLSDRDQSTWYKIRNPEYSQKAGREELFERRKLLKKMVSAEGIESALKGKLNNIQGHGWHPRP